MVLQFPQQPQGQQPVPGASPFARPGAFPAPQQQPQQPQAPAWPQQPQQPPAQQPWPQQPQQPAFAPPMQQPPMQPAWPQQPQQPTQTFAPQQQPMQTAWPQQQQPGAFAPQAPQQPQGAAPGLFANIATARMGIDSNYLREGHYLMLLRRVKAGCTRKNINFMAIEMTILAVVQQLGPQTQRPGEEVTHMLMANFDGFLGEVKKFVVGCYDCQETEVTDQAVREIVSDANPMGGMLIEVLAKDVMTKKNALFTRVSYKRRVSYGEVAQLIQPQTAQLVFGPGVFEACLAKEQGRG